MVNSNFLLQCPRLIDDNYETSSFRVKVWLGSQDVLDIIKKSFEELINKATLTSAQRIAIQQAQRKDQLALIISHQYLDGITFKIVANITTAK